MPGVDPSVEYPRAPPELPTAPGLGGAAARSKEIPSAYDGPRGVPPYMWASKVMSSPSTVGKDPP